MHVGVIPARGGSKSIPRKNLAVVAGLSLLGWTARAALGSKHLGRAILSTDDAEIAKAGRALGLDVPWLRPAHLAQDETPILPVLADLLGRLEGEGTTVTSLVLLQPTSPLRTARHIDEAIDLFDARGAATVVSVTRVPHRFNPWSVMAERDGRLAPFLEGGGSLLRRQDKPLVFARNGPAVLVLSPAQIRSGALYGANTVGYEMSEADSLDVDEPADLPVVERALLERHRPG